MKGIRYRFQKSEATNGIVIVLIVVLCILIGWNYWLPTARRYFFEKNPSAPRPNTDFYGLFTTGKAFKLGLNPYMDNGQITSTLSVPSRGGGYSCFIYPPTMLPIYSLLAKLEYTHARVLWVVFYMFSYLLAFIIMILHSDKSDRLSLFILGSLFTLTSHPLLFHIRQGQIDLLVISLILVSFFCYKGNLKLLSAILLSLAALTKVNPVLFLATFVVFYRDVKYFVWFLASSVVLVAVSLLFVPLQLYVDYFTKVLPSIVSGKSYYYNQSLIKFVANMELLPKLIPMVGFALFAVFAWLLGKKYRNGEIRDFQFSDSGFVLVDILFLMNALVILLFSGISWHMAYVWVILPSAICMSYLVRHGRHWFIGVTVWAMLLLNARIYPLPILDSLNILGGLLLLCCLTVLVLRREWVTLTERSEIRGY